MDLRAGALRVMMENMAAPDGTRLVDELRRHAAAAPDRPALFAPGRAPLSYGRFWAHVQAIAGALAQAGLGRDDAVATVLPDGPELICASLGVACVSAFAPLDPALNQTEFEFYLSNLHAASLVVQEGSASPALEAAQTLGIPVLAVRPTPEEGAGLFTLPGAEAGRTAPIGQTGFPDPAVLLHTSATAGRSKLVCLTHSNLRAMAENSVQALALSDADRFLSLMPLFHLQGLLAAMYQLMVGGSLVCPGGFEAAKFLAWLREFHPTWYTAGPALHHAILAVVQEEPEVLRQFPLRFARSIGAALPPALLADLEEALHAPVLEGYGLTEAGAVTSTPLPPQVRKPGSAGVRSTPGVAIADESGNLLPAGREGEILVRGPCVTPGYRNDPEANRDAFRGGWLRTGDLGRFDSEGYLYVTGRIKEMINRGGEKILPGEIDQVLAAHPAIAEAAAFGIPHPTLGEEVAAAAVPHPGAEVTESELRRFAAARLAPFKVPRRIVFLDAVPKGATGKPRRRALAEQVQAATTRVAFGRAPFVAASSPLEEKLAEIWARILGTVPIGMDDDFFGLGGDSLATTVMLAEVQGAFGELPNLSEFFLEPTIATLARVVCAQTEDTSRRSQAAGGCVSSVLVLQSHGSRAPLFCIPGVSDDPYYFRHLASRLGRMQPFYVLRDQQPARPDGPLTVEAVAERIAAALRSVQPHGPYLLGGHCYGGIVAFELACRLAACGEKVALLALFDSPAPGYPKILRHWKRYCRLAISFPFDKHLSLRDVISHLRLLLRLAGRRAATLFRTLLRSPCGVPGNASENAARNYMPRPFPGKVHVFLAEDERHSARILEDSRLGWRDFARGGFESHTVSGGHDSMFVEPHVRELAERLETLLEAESGETIAAESRAAYS